MQICNLGAFEPVKATKCGAKPGQAQPYREVPRSTLHMRSKYENKSLTQTSTSVLGREKSNVHGCTINKTAGSVAVLAPRRE